VKGGENPNVFVGKLSRKVPGRRRHPGCKGTSKKTRFWGCLTKITFSDYVQNHEEKGKNPKTKTPEPNEEVNRKMLGSASARITDLKNWLGKRVVSLELWGGAFKIKGPTGLIFAMWGVGKKGPRNENKGNKRGRVQAGTWGPTGKREMSTAPAF